MKKYCIDDFTNKDDYLKFIEYMLKVSDSFSFVYIRYYYQDKLSYVSKKVKSILKNYKIFSYDVDKSSKRDKKQHYENPHIYRFIMYRSEPKAIDAFAQADSLFSWGFERYPRDLAFYKDDYAWFRTHSASRYAVLYTNDNKIIDDLKELGVSITYAEDIDDSFAQYDEISGKKIFPY